MGIYLPVVVITESLSFILYLFPVTRAGSKILQP